MVELGWLLLMDLTGCGLVALLLTALTGTRRAGGRYPERSTPRAKAKKTGATLPFATSRI